MRCFQSKRCKVKNQDEAAEVTQTVSLRGLLTRAINALVSVCVINLVSNPSVSNCSTRVVFVFTCCTVFF